MPKLARYLLAWSIANEQYELYEQEQAVNILFHEEEDWWFTWLEEHTSFSFHGKQGKLTLLKEPRVRGTAYWYAYRSQNRRTVKHYVGRTVDLTIEHLETVAGSFRPQQMPLLEAKLHPPRLNTTLVERNRLLKKLDAIRDHKLTLITAPAGTGKTTVICQWLAGRRTGEQTPPVAWISLESSDNDPLRFWRYVITACQIFHAHIGQASLEQLSTRLPPFEMPSLEMVLTSLLNDMEQHEGNGLLVLDDYHLITASHIHETMTFFLTHLPAQLNVIMLTRGEPPLPLASFRARGDLFEIRARDLRFSHEEMEAFFQQSLAFSLSALTSEGRNLLESRLEGWAVGLRLLALSLQGREQPQKVEQLLATFAGEQRPFQDYFVAEILNALPASRQEFLLHTCCLHRLTGSLCDAVMGRRDSHYLLEEIERAGIFLESLDQTGEWYRYHALFAEAMQAEARRRLGEDTLHALSLKASHWYEQRGLLAEAVEAAFQAQDMIRAAELLEHILGRIEYFILSSQVLQAVGGFHTLRGLLEQLPEAAFRGRPILSLGYAATLLFVFIVDQPPPSQVFTHQHEHQFLALETLWRKIEEALRMAEEEFRATGDLLRLGEALAFHALVAREQGSLREAITYARESLAWLPEGNQGWRNISLNVIGMGKLVDGQLEEAKNIFLRLCATCERFGNRAILRAHTVLLNIITYEQGKLHQAATFFQQMLVEAREDGDSDDIAHASLLLAWLSYEWDDLQAVEQQAQEAFWLGRQIGNEEFQVQATLVLARIERASGYTERALQRCTTLLAHLPAISPLRSRLCREIQMAQAGLSLAIGDCSAVERWWASNPSDQDLPLVQREREELLLARWLTATGRATEATHVLTRLFDAARYTGRMRSALEIQAVLVVALYSCGQIQEARQSLQTLLTHAHTEGYLRLFLDEGEAMVTLLRLTLPLLHEQHLIAYAQMILNAADPVYSQQTPPAYMLLVEPLSEQEQRVLRLLIAGYSNSDIAHDLVVSVNTVKAHLKNIYRKLDVKNRMQACQAARHLEFL